MVTHYFKEIPYYETSLTDGLVENKESRKKCRLLITRRTLKCTKAQSSPCNHLTPFILKVDPKKSDSFWLSGFSKPNK